MSDLNREQVLAIKALLDRRRPAQAAGLYLQWRYGVTVHHLEIKRRLLKIMYGGK